MNEEDVEKWKWLHFEELKKPTHSEEIKEGRKREREKEEETVGDAIELTEAPAR